MDKELFKIKQEKGEVIDLYIDNLINVQKLSPEEASKIMTETAEGIFDAIKKGNYQYIVRIHNPNSEYNADGLIMFPRHAGELMMVARELPKDLKRKELDN